MRYVIFVALLLLAACDKPSTPPPQIAAPQREALEKAREVDQVVQDQAAAAQKQIDEASQ